MLSTAGTTNYCYAADGTKLAVRDASGNGFAYLGSLILSPSSTEFQFSDGVIRKTTSGYEVNYFLKDHLGSVRTVVNAAGEVVQQSDYYPFGSKHENATYANNSNKFLYNGKELQTTGNLGFLDYGARMYDAKLGRWFVQDNLAEKYTAFSPYNYVLNNPIKYIDPDGTKVVDAQGRPMFDSNGRTTEYATKDAIRASIYMRATSLGRKQWDKLEGSKANIQILFSSDVVKSNTSITFGQLQNGRVINAEKEGKTLYSATIVIFEGSVKEYLNGGYKKTNEETNVTIEEYIGAVLGHEAEHTTDENVSLNYDEAPENIIEQKPNEIKSQILQEIQQLKNRVIK